VRSAFDFPGRVAGTISRQWSRTALALSAPLRSLLRGAAASLSVVMNANRLRAFKPGPFFGPAFQSVRLTTSARRPG
jgi:hypothetical protein